MPAPAWRAHGDVLGIAALGSSVSEMRPTTWVVAADDEMAANIVQPMTFVQQPARQQRRPGRQATEQRLRQPRGTGSRP